jgi:acyl-CoA thioesterase
MKRKVPWRLMGKEKYLAQVKDLVNRSPYYQLLGIEIVKMRKGVSTLRMRFRKELTHALGMMHGGAIASLADSAVAMALITLVDPSDRITTIEFKVNFVAPVEEGKLTAQAKILHRGGKTAVGDVEVLNQKGDLVAKVIATYSIKKVV